jgi:transposase
MLRLSILAGACDIPKSGLLSIACPTAPLSNRIPARFVLPDLNPIEQVFAKLKHLLRKAAARTVEAVWAAIARLLPAFVPKECANYFENAGYAST